MTITLIIYVKFFANTTIGCIIYKCCVGVFDWGMQMEEKKILIVEDDPDNQELLKEIIDYCMPDYKYTAACDGEDALIAAKKQEFDLIFMDMSVPKKNGYEILTELRKSKNYMSVPIIALTAHTMDGTKEKILDSGFDEYIAKPCNPKVLIDTIKKYLENKKKILFGA